MSSVMYCEALAFVAAQLHAAKCVQRYKCSEIAQALKETLCFLFVLFVISVNIRLISVPDLLPKTYCKLRLNCIPRYIFRVLLNLDQAEDWSTLRIGVSYGTILTLSTIAREDRRESRKKEDKRVVAKIESYKVLERRVGERKKRLPDSKLVLRQEDGAVRLEKKIALETHRRVVTKRNVKKRETNELSA